MLFHFTKSNTASNLNSLHQIRGQTAHLGGFLLIDSGNEDTSYLYRCQERYVTYATLAGIRCLLFVQNEEHRLSYLRRLTDLQKRLELVSEQTNIDFPAIRNPVFVNQDFEVHSLDSEVTGSLKNGIFCNQISPSGALLFKQMVNRFSVHNLDIEAYEKAGALAMRFNDKTEYVQLFNKMKHHHQLPLHTPTATLTSESLSGLNWNELNEAYTHQTGQKAVDEYFIKSALDAGGEGSILVNQRNLPSGISNLKASILEKENKGREEKNLNLLVQPKVKAIQKGDYPKHIGFVYNINRDRTISRIDIHGQVYADKERKEYLGSFLSKDFEDFILSRLDEQLVINLCSLFADEGYQGPINFDAILNDKEEIEFIFDCNPRMSAALPNIILQDFFQQLGVPMISLVNVGYRGRMIYKDLNAKINELKDNKLLFGKTKNKGVLILPSFVRLNSYDVWFINMTISEKNLFISKGDLHTFADKNECDFTGLYF